MINRILEYNKRFVQKRKEMGLDKPISSHAKQEVMIFTCMDTRLIDLVEPAMGFKRGDIKIIKNPGNSIRKNCDEIIRSISLGTIMMGLKEVYVVGHKDCGMKNLTEEEIKERMILRGIEENIIDSLGNLKEWAGIIDNEKENVRKVVTQIKSSPFIPNDVKIYGLIIDPYTGELEVVTD